MSRLDKAIEDFEDETLDLSLGERISGLCQALMYETFKKLQRINDKVRTSDEEDARLVGITKWYKEMEKLYTLQLKNNKLTGKSEDTMDKDFLKRIKDLKSSIGEIVVRIPKPENVFDN